MLVEIRGEVESAQDEAFHLSTSGRDGGAVTMGGVKLGGAPIRRPISGDTGPVCVPTAEQVEALVRAIPYGESRSVKDLRLDLADGQGADSACAVATGRHLRNLAQSVAEQLAAGASVEEVAPVWRVLDETSPLLRRLAGGSRPLASRRRAEVPAAMR